VKFSKIFGTNLSENPATNPHTRHLI